MTAPRHPLDASRGNASLLDITSETTTDDHARTHSVGEGCDHAFVYLPTEVAESNEYDIVDRSQTPELQIIDEWHRRVRDLLTHRRAMRDEMTWVHAYQLGAEAEERRQDSATPNGFGSMQMPEGEEYETDYDPRHFSMSIVPNASSNSPMSSMESSMFLSTTSGSSRRSPSCMSFQLFGHTLVGLEGISGGFDGYFFVSAPLKLADPDSNLGDKEALAIKGVEQK